MKLIVNPHKVEIIKEPVNEREIDITKCEFEFADEITNNYVKEAYFTFKGTTYKQIIINNQCSIPSEVLTEKGQVELGVVAYLVANEEEIKRYNPSPAYFNTWLGSLKDNAENSEPITPSEMEQYEQALQDGLEEVNSKLPEINQAIEDVNEAITQTNNLDLDVSKEGKTATVTLTKKDATTKTVTLSDGTNLMFNWNGTSLGIKTDEDADYTYVDLQGVQGETGPMGAPFTIKKTYSSVAEMNADFNNMNVGDYVMIASTVEVEDNAKLYTKGEEQWIFISDFSGAQGIKGETGATPNIQIGTVTSGATPSVTRTGTNENPVLNFTLVKGDKGDTGETGQTGATGNGISSIVKTSTSGLVDTYTITYTDGTTSTFEVTNGEDGEVTQAQLDETNRTIDYYKTTLNALPKVTGTGTEITLNDTAECPMPMSLKPSATSQATEPTPANPQDIHTVSGNNTITISNSDNTESQTLPLNLPVENLFDKDNVTANTGLTSEGGTFSSNNYCITDYLKISGNVSLTLHSNAETYTKRVCFYTSNNESSFISVQEIVRKKIFTFTTPATCQYIRIQTEQSDKDNTMLEKGTKANTYTPYGTTPIELCKIGTYEDYFYKDNGKWYLHKDIRKYTFTGNEPFRISGNAFQTSTIFPSGVATRTSDDFAYMDTYKYAYYSSSVTSNIKNYEFSWSGGKLMTIKNDNYENIDDFIASLKDDILYFPLNSPTNTEITDSTLISQLENIYNWALSYKDQTNISQVNNDLPFVITASAVRDMSNIFDLISGTEL